MNNGNRRIDIIVPIYNALDDLKICVNSLKKCVDFTKDRVILVNDHSPDQKVLPYLRSIESDNFIVLDNEENLGFSGSVNRGMEYSHSDVILLNSDTLVTKNWTDKIYKCAYSNPYVGTVTPFSNSATICSLPNYCMDNNVDKSCVESLAYAVEKISMQQYPRIPVAHGFCMFIKREVINKVGLFNAQVFKRGYGEENDFCYRMEQYGYINVICDDAFVYHKGTASFTTADKAKLAAEHTKWLEEHYPQQMRNTHLYTLKDYNIYNRKMYSIFSAIQNGKKNILYILHLDFKDGSSNPFGGVQMHVKDLKKDLVEDNNIFVLSRENNQLMLTVYADKEEFVLNFDIYKQDSFQIFYDNKYAEIFGLILDAFEIDIVHIHHIQGLSLDIYNEAYERKLPIITTLHDYYFVCPSLMMVNTNMISCLGVHDKEECKKCLWQSKNISSDTFILSDWRKIIEEALCKSSKIVAPSESVRKNYEIYYPKLKGKIDIIEHGLDICDAGKIENIITSLDQYDEPESVIEAKLTNDKPNIAGWAFIPDCESHESKIYIYVKHNDSIKYFLAKTRERNDVANAFQNEAYRNSGFFVSIPLEILKNTEFQYGIIVENKNGEVRVTKPIKFFNKSGQKNNNNVAFIGGISQHKGSELIYKIVNNRSKKNHIKWFLFGGIGDPKLNTLVDTKLFTTGFYNREDLPGMIKNHNIELVCILSVAPETFCYTLTEALQSGVPVLVKDVGALGDRVRAMNCGWVVSKDIGEKELVRFINDIFANTDEYNEKKKNVANLHLKSVHEMCNEYRELMKSLYRDHRYIVDFDKQKIWNAYINAEQPNQRRDDPNLIADLKKQLDAKNNELNWIYNSYGWKVVLWFRNAKIPGKGTLKKLILSIFHALKK